MNVKLVRITLAALSIHCALAGRMERQDATELAETEVQAASLSFEEPVELAEKTTVTTKTGKQGKDDPYGIGSFVVGCMMIPFSLVLLWKNEKKLVTYAKVISQAREECRTIEAEAPDGANEFKLVHCMGTTENKEEIAD